ncbi:MAG: hypothetical protein V1792_29790 [Pseudomonadota bacterium]
MHQVIPNIRYGELTVATVPEALSQQGHVLGGNAASLMSVETERMAMNYFGSIL